MSRFRIRKGDREHTASRLETLQELASRGLLRPEDPVSVDQGPFRPAAEIAELADVLAAAEPAEDPWRHWGEAEEALDEDDVLTSFLDQLSSGSMPSVPDTLSSPSQAALAPARTPAPLPSVEPEPLDAADAEPLDTVEPEPLDAAEPEPFDAGDLAPAEEPAPPLFAKDVPAESRPELRLVEPEPTPPPALAEPEGSPVSFSDWIEQKGGGESGRLLENFGNYDDGVIVANRQRRELINPWRVAMLVLVGAAAIGFWTMWVRTAAQTQFPSEDELEQRVPGAFRSTALPDIPIKEGKQDQREVEVRARYDADRALKDGMRGDIIHFSNREGLEDALFQELFNAHVSPLSVEVEALELRGGTELGEVPVRSNVVVKLQAPKGAEYGDAQFQASLKAAWLLLGKYQAQSRIRIEEATVVMTEPLPFDERYEGKRLLALWNGQLTADALFLDNR